MSKVRLLAVCCLAFSMGCASIKDTARDAAAEAWANIRPDLVATGKELAEHATATAKTALGEFVTSAKGDIGGALASIPGLAKDAGEAVATRTIAERLKVDAELSSKAEEFEQRAKDEGLPAALEWLFGGGALTIAAGLGRLWWRTRGALKVTTHGVEGLPPDQAAAVKAAVAAAGGKAFDKEIQAALRG